MVAVVEWWRPSLASCAAGETGLVSFITVYLTMYIFIFDSTFSRDRPVARGAALAPKG